MSKPKYKTNNETIIISIPIETDEYLRKFILDNSYMRNKIRNDFAEEANKYKGEWNKYKDFDVYDFRKRYLNSIEIIKDSDNNIIYDRYKYYCVGLSDQVGSDFKYAINSIRASNTKAIDNAIKSQTPLSQVKLGEFHYKKFDYVRYGFRVRLKPSIGPNNNVRSRLRIIDNTHVVFTVRSNKYRRPKEYINITLKESLYDDVICDYYIRYYKSNGYINGCTFGLFDIKDICFKYECGNYYIQLFTTVSYNIDKKSLKYSKNNICGIDTGIRHPITIYDDNGVHYISMDDKTTRKIHYLERRINRLKNYRSLKYNSNMERTGYMYSNNTIKLTKKIRRLYRKITNIKIHWIRNICKQITTTYNSIVVDTFEQPINSKVKDIPKVALRKINYANRFHNMYYFNEFLKHDCIKYGCEYIESPDYTTCTCSICNHINPHLKLRDTHLTCERCGNVIERDENAAKNCYFYALEKSKVV